MTNAFSLPSFCCMCYIPFFRDSLYHFFVYRTISPTDLLHPSSSPHFKSFKIFLVYFPKHHRFNPIKLCSRTRNYIPRKECDTRNQCVSVAGHSSNCSLLFQDFSTTCLCELHFTASSPFNGLRIQDVCCLTDTR